MDNWNFIKEEPQGNEFYAVKSKYRDTLDSYFTFDSGQLYDDKVKNEECQKVGMETNNTWKAKSIFYPEPSVRLVPLEYSKNKEVRKYLKSMMPVIAFSSKFSSDKTAITDLNQYVKTESVELETLTENTLVRSSLETLYASPWDFVKLSNKFGQTNNATSKIAKKKQKHHTTTSGLPQYMPNKNIQSNSLRQTARKNNKNTVETFACQHGDEVKQMTEMNTNSRIITRDNEKLWECDICGKKFRARYKLCQHMQTHNGKMYSCDKCLRSYTYRSTLRRHAEIHNEGNEKKIMKTCVSRDFIVQAKKSKIDEKVETETSNKLYECDVCHERFEKKSNMRVHIEFLHIELSGKQTHKPRTESQLKSFKCMKCDKRYTQSSHLYRHEATHLPNKLYYCEKCNISFGRRSNLSRHMIHKHSEKYLARSNDFRKEIKAITTSFVCKICEKSFRTHYDLRRHCAMHDARKPYECDICKKRFSLRSYLYAHVLTHDNWKSYPCNKCSKFYRRKSSLQRHIEIDHSGKKNTMCQICHKSYKHLPSYNVHMKNHR